MPPFTPPILFPKRRRSTVRPQGIDDYVNRFLQHSTYSRVARLVELYAGLPRKVVRKGGMLQSDGRKKTLRKSSRRHAPHSPESYEDVDVRATTMELRWLPCRPSATEAEERTEMAYNEYRCGAPPPPRPSNGQGTERSRILAGKRGCGSPTSWRAALR